MADDFLNIVGKLNLVFYRLQVFRIESNLKQQSI